MADRVSSLLRSVSRAKVIGAALQKVLALLGRKKDVTIQIYVKCALARLGDAESRLGASIRGNQPDFFASRARS